MVRKSQEGKKESVCGFKKKSDKEPGQKVHTNKYASNQNLESGGVKRTITVGKKQRGKGKKKKRVVTIKMSDGSEPDVGSYSFFEGDRRKHGRIPIEGRYKTVTSRYRAFEDTLVEGIPVRGTASRHRTLDDIPARSFREALSQRVEVDYESIFVFEKGFRGDYSVISKDPDKTFIRLLMYLESSEKTKVYTQEGYKNYDSLERVKTNNKGKVGLDDEIRAIRKVIQKGIGKQGEISFHNL